MEQIIENYLQKTLLNSIDNTLEVLAVVLGTTTIHHLLTSFITKKNQKKSIEAKREAQIVGQVTSLNLYPVKSAGGLKLDQAICTDSGLVTQDENIHDRQWAIGLKKDGYYQAQSRREMPQIALISVSYKGNMVQLDAPNMESLLISCNSNNADNNNQVKIRIAAYSNELTNSIECGGDEATRWLQQFLHHSDMSIILITPDVTLRHLENMSEAGVMEGYNVRCQDTAPFMVASQASLEDINGRLETPVPMVQFRPNIEVSGCGAFDEDDWQEIRVGEAVFSKVAKCYRCMLITVGESTGKKHPKMEPFRTLKSYRPTVKYRGLVRPYFGVWFKLVKPGKISIGDEILLISNKS